MLGAGNSFKPTIAQHRRVPDMSDHTRHQLQCIHTYSTVDQRRQDLIICNTLLMEPGVCKNWVEMLLYALEC